MFMHWFLLDLSWCGVYQFMQPSVKLYAAKDKYMQLQNLMKGNISFAPEYSIQRYYHAQMLLLVAAFLHSTKTFTEACTYRLELRILPCS